VDDDVDVLDELGEELQSRHYDVRTSVAVSAARDVFRKFEPDVCLVDLVMPGTSGQVFCREVAESGRTGIIVVSAVDSDATRIAMLELGADDYVLKPVNPCELHARIKALLRRRGGGAQPKRSRFGHWSVDPDGRRLRAGDGRSVALSPSEALVLEFFSANPGVVFKREELLAVSRVRQHAGKTDRSVDMLIRRLRQKIEPDPAEPVFIRTVWGRGYTFASPPEPFPEARDVGA
jgi:DNA-binding response OmpR family regulator